MIAIQETLEDIEAAPIPDDGALRRVSDLAARQIVLEADLDAANAEVRRITQLLDAVRARDLPKAMEDAGLSEFKVRDGPTVKVRTVYAASISPDWPPEQRERAFTWLEEVGSGAIIKHDVAVQFGRGDGKHAGSLLRFIRSSKWLGRYKVTDKQYVHPGTLAALVRERTEANLEVPMEMVGAHILTSSVVVRPKKEGL